MINFHLNIFLKVPLSHPCISFFSPYILGSEVLITQGKGAKNTQKMWGFDYILEHGSFKQKIYIFYLINHF